MVELNKVQIINDRFNRKMKRLNNLELMQDCIAVSCIPISFAGSMAGTYAMMNNGVSFYCSLPLTLCGISAISVPSCLKASELVYKRREKLAESMVKDLDKLHEYALEDNEVYSKAKTWRTFYK